MKIKGKTFVVTGGGGLGRALVLALLQKEANVAMLDINESAMEETLQLAKDYKTNLSKHIVNITDKEQVFALPEKIIKIHGAVDGVINNAGIIQPFVDVKELELQVVERIMNINFYGTLYMVKAFLPFFEKRPEAHIVNISNMGGFIPFPGQTYLQRLKSSRKTTYRRFVCRIKTHQYQWLLSYFLEL
ncbi:SDR family NAD(P)-dependent oxidoreductase [Mesonia aestuariivivens]|uniref:SDR family oxidoreductase n=1 Tax=Mesonia aestuariivivens TaxID=2796128 RepID=A0ABS6W2M9_9FLAO|nr:SDR family NAD(P)-dependent oxidoreductase [Mesonia aestuariivivens]MBW2962100.1 SDR family oxidoreductase [Mesonia aestuariivivens]